MIIDPPIEKLSDKVGNKYALCVLASKRALQIQKEHIENQEEGYMPELSEAAEQIWEDEVVAVDGRDALSTVKVSR